MRRWKPKRDIAWACKQGLYDPQLGHIARGKPYPPCPPQLEIDFQKRTGGWTRLTPEEKEFMRKVKGMEWDMVTNVEQVRETIEHLAPNSVRGPMGAGKKTFGARPIYGTRLGIGDATLMSADFSALIATR